MKSVATILGLIDGNRELPYVFRDSFKSIAFEVPSRYAVMQVKALRHKLDNEIRGSERKIDKLKKEHRLKIGNLSAESQQKLEDAAKTHKLSLKVANEQIRESVSKISQFESAFAVHEGGTPLVLSPELAVTGSRTDGYFEILIARTDLNVSSRQLHLEVETRVLLNRWGGASQHESSQSTNHSEPKMERRVRLKN